MAASRWLADRCELDAKYSCLSTALYADYKKWADDAGLGAGAVVSKAKFQEGLLDNDHGQKRRTEGMVNIGLKLKHKE